MRSDARISRLVGREAILIVPALICDAARELLVAFLLLTAGAERRLEGRLLRAVRATQDFQRHVSATLRRPRSLCFFMLFFRFVLHRRGPDFGTAFRSQSGGALLC